jgi:hypothetical protein
MLKTEKYGQFPFQRWHKRQNQTFLAPCGSEGVLGKNHDFEQKMKIFMHTAEHRDFLQYLRKWIYRNEFLSYKQPGHGVGNL